MAHAMAVWRSLGGCVYCESFSGRSWTLSAAGVALQGRPWPGCGQGQPRERRLLAPLRDVADVQHEHLGHGAGGDVEERRCEVAVPVQARVAARAAHD